MIIEQWTLDIHFSLTSNDLISANENVIKVLCEHGADVDIPDNEGRTALYWAVENGCYMLNFFCKLFTEE